MSSATVDASWRDAILPVTATIKEAIANLDHTGVKIALVVDERLVLEGTISDGDIRRGLLRGLTMESRISDIVHRTPLVVPPGIGRDTVLNLMTANKIQQIPIVDEQRAVLGLHLWDTIAEAPVRPNAMVIMAGGLGRRLLPLTENCPKPLLPVAGKPMLEHIIEHAKAEGFRHFVLAIHYLGHMIENHFGDGSRFDVRIEYLKEESPLGTAGALSLLSPRPNVPFVVSNGDVMTDIRYGDVLDFHIRHNAAGTMAVRLHEWQHPFGVVQTDGVEIVGFEEKPIARTHINAGIYALSPEALSFLVPNSPATMPELFARLQTKSLRTVAYPMHEPWLDVGRPDDLRTINEASR